MARPKKPKPPKPPGRGRLAGLKEYNKQKEVDLTGSKVGHLTAVCRTDKRIGSSYVWECKCNCGKTVYVSAYTFRKTRKTKLRSCGCATESTAKSKTKSYQSWSSMLHRAFKSKIDVQPEWRTYEVFIADIGERPAGYQLYRVDPSKGFVRGNCTWLEIDRGKKEGTIYRSSCVAYQGVIKPLTQWADELNINADKIRKRLKAGWTAEQALGFAARIKNEK
jgi:hypothetical protein